MQDAMCERASIRLVPRPVFDHFHAIWKTATETSKLYSNNNNNNNKTIKNELNCSDNNVQQQQQKMTPKKRELQCYAESSWVTSGTPDSTCPGSYYQLYFGCILEFIVFNISLHLSFSAFE